MSETRERRYKSYGSHVRNLLDAEAETTTPVVDDKWLATLDTAIHGEMDRISQALTQRVKELAERYENPMPQLTDRLAELEAKFRGHLQRMGFAS